jgi:hypothetical protein
MYIFKSRIASERDRIEIKRSSADISVTMHWRYDVLVMYYCASETSLRLRRTVSRGP